MPTAASTSDGRLRGRAGSATGRAILGGWGFGADEVAEAWDSLYDLAQSYEEEDGI